MELKDLGKYKIERTEDYENARKDGLDISYYEMIRVKGSKPEKCFTVASHLYKYSNNKLGLYLKDHKNYWKALGTLLNYDIDIADDEILFVFDGTKFKEVNKIIKFVKSKSRNTPLNEKERINASNRLMNYNKNIRDIERQKGIKTSVNRSKGIILLDRFMEVKK